jgi:thiamine biosynthesis lipoprotein
MGTDVHLMAVGGPPDGLEQARELVLSLEARWSRFRPDSELCRLNAAAGQPVILPDDTFALVAAAVNAWAVTSGRFDPTVLAALAAAGYDRSFELVRPEGPATREPMPPVPGCAGIALHRGTGLVLLPAGVALDLGGIAKGHTADQVTAGLLAGGAAGVMANLGGDVRVAGTPPEGDAWLIGIEDPRRSGRDVAVVALEQGAVATSSRVRRSWRRGSRTFHHLIDPVTGAPSDAGVDAAVVVAGEAAWAEVLAKAALVAGPGVGAEMVRSFGATGLLVLEGGEVVHLPGLEEYLA